MRLCSVIYFNIRSTLFSKTINPFCTCCSLWIRLTIHFFLQCHNRNTTRKTLLDDLKTNNRTYCQVPNKVWRPHPAPACYFFFFFSTTPPNFIRIPPLPAPHPPPPVYLFLQIFCHICLIKSNKLSAEDSHRSLVFPCWEWQ